MFDKANYSELPQAILYIPLPTGEADIWLRKNTETRFDAEAGEVFYTADEAYMRASGISESEIADDFERFFDIASAWTPQCGSDARPPAIEERVGLLESESTALRVQLEATMEAVDFLLFGGSADI